ncbi:MAG: tetratricopeptide repeat protein [Bacteroidota bacterium]
MKRIPKPYWIVVQILLILISFQIAKGQTNLNKDELIKAVLHAKSDSIAVDLFNDLAWEYRRISTDSSIFYANKGLQLAIRLDYLRGQSDSWNRKGNAYELLGNLINAEQAYLKALEIDKKIGDSYRVGRDYHQVGVVNSKMGNYQKAKAYEILSIEKLEALPSNRKNELALASIYNSTGNVFKKLGEYKEALRYFRIGLSKREELGDSIGISKSLNEVALVYEYLKIYRTALRIHRQSLSISERATYLPGQANSLQNIGNIYTTLAEFDSALIYYQKSLKLTASYTDKIYYQDLVHNIGILYMKKGETEKALEQLHQSLETRQVIGNEIKIAESYYYIGLAHFYEDTLGQALKYLEMARKTLQNHRSPLLEAKILQKIGDSHTLLGDSSEALNFFLKYSALADSLSEKERSGLKLDQELIASQYQLKIAKNKLELEVLNNAKQRIIFYSIVGGVVLFLALMIFSALNYKNRQRAIIAEQEVQLRQNEIDNLLKTQELELVTAVLNGQDEVRHKIASDLHDRLGGILSMVRLHFKEFEKNILKIGDRLEEQYRVADDLLNEATETVRNISHEIGDRLLLNLGLLPAVRDLAYKIESSRQLSVTVVAHDFDDRLPPKVEKNLYKIIQELLSNILKHADAQNITLNFLDVDDHLSITVEDDGKGFDTNTGSAQNGMGMISIYSRVEEINGSIIFDSQIGHGTTVALEIPYKSINSTQQ